VQKVLYVLTFPTAAIATVLAGWNGYELVFGAFSLPLLNWVAVVGAWFAVFLILAGIAWNWFEHGKVPALAVTTGGIAAYFGAHVHALYDLRYVTVIVGVVTLVTWFFVAFPAAYWIVKLPAWVFSLILRRLLMWVYDFARGRFERIANRFAAIYQWLVETPAPYFEALGKWIARIREMWARIRKTLTGK
jgi:hypothetical protein